MKTAAITSLLIRHPAAVLTVLLLWSRSPAGAQDVASAVAEPAASELQEVRRFDAPEATQAVAVDDAHFYAIANSIIARYDRRTGERNLQWVADAERPLRHLNSGIVIEGRLYCANSNFPRYPMTSSIEVWDTETLQHVHSHSLGICDGSLTWIDRRDGAWWAVFAHYTLDEIHDLKPNAWAKDHTWTSLVRFDLQWRRQASWVFPQEVLDRFRPYSCSGGCWGPDNRLYCTGHDLGEVYQLTLPKAGSELRYDRTFKATLTGQGIAWTPDGSQLWGIDRSRRQVVVSQFAKRAQ